jgi:hypothetical protein
LILLILILNGSLVRHSFIKVRLFIYRRNCLYFLDFHQILPKTFVNSDSLTLQFTATIVLIRRYGSVHIRFFINVSQFIIFVRIFLLGVCPFSIIFRTTDQWCPINLSILASYRIITFCCIYIQCVILCLHCSIIYLRTVEGIVVVVADCSLLFVYLWADFWTWCVLPVTGRVL